MLSLIATVTRHNTTSSAASLSSSMLITHPLTHPRYTVLPPAPRSSTLSNISKME